MILLSSQRSAYKRRPFFRTGPAGLNIAKIEGPPTTGLWGYGHSEEVYSDTACTTLQTTDNGAVAAFKDLSGQSHHLTQSSSGARPLLHTNQVNTKSSIRLDGSDDCLECTTGTLAMPVHFFLLMKQISWTANDIICGKYDTGSSGKYVIQGDTTPEFRAVGPGFNNSGLAVGSWGIVQVSFITGTNTSYSRVNNSSAVFHSGSWTGDDGTGFSLGRAAQSSGAYSNFELEAWMVYAGTAITNGSQMQSDIFAYLNSRGAIY